MNQHAGRPNIVLVLSDDHAAHAISAYGSRINRTPWLDSLADEGMRLDNCFCTNSICAPSRATILTGTYNHVNGVTTLWSKLDARQPAFPAMLQASGYQTAVVGKWHLGHGGIHDPVGFDYWDVLIDQGLYVDPVLLGPDGERTVPGYATDVITDLSVQWLDARDRSKPFCLLVHHKAPHRPWTPDDKHKDMYEDVDVTVPDTFDDDYEGRVAAAEAEMRVGRDLNEEDLKGVVPEGLSDEEAAFWCYQRYIKDYLRCIASVDDNVGRLLEHLRDDGVLDDTIFLYTSDQGFFLGDHGWYDKRFMYEESLRMPLLVRYPREIPPGSTNDDLVLNVDLAQTLLDYAGVPAHPRMQGHSLRGLLRGEHQDGWRSSVYYRYWEHLSRPHRVGAHYGVRTVRHKLICYYGKGLGQPGASDEVREVQWELFDLATDPAEMHNLYGDPEYAEVQAQLEQELDRIQAEVGDTPAFDEPARD